MKVTKPEYYERAPDGERWPGTLKGLLKAIDDTWAHSFATDDKLTLSAIRDGHAVAFRSYQKGREVRI